MEKEPNDNQEVNTKSWLTRDLQEMLLAFNAVRESVLHNDVLGLRSTWRLMHSIVLVSNYLLESAHHSIELENQLAKFIGLA